MTSVRSFCIMFSKKEFWKNVYMRYRNLTFHVEKNRHFGVFIDIHRRYFVKNGNFRD